MKRTTKIIAASTILLVAGLLTPIIGPFTFYDEVVPIIGPILPKPEGVPSSADASYNWKGAGLYWSWQKRYKSGCISWGAADNGRYNEVSLIPVDTSCSDASQSVDKYSFSEEIIFGGAHDLGGGKPCPFSVDESYIASVQKLVEDAQIGNISKIETAALKRVEQRLDNVNGAALATYSGNGCSDLTP